MKLLYKGLLLALLHLLLVGSESTAPYRQLARSLGIAEWVTVTNGMNGHFQDLLCAMDVGVQIVPGSEGSARGVLELMALGKPVVVRAVGSLAETVDAGCGRLFSSEAALAEELICLLSDKRLRESLGRTARERIVARHNVEGWIAAHERFYRRLLPAPPAASAERTARPPCET